MLPTSRSRSLRQSGNQSRKLRPGRRFKDLWLVMLADTLADLEGLWYEINAEARARPPLRRARPLMRPAHWLYRGPTSARRLGVHAEQRRSTLRDDV
ncbi:MAG: hypothetical protein P4L84_35995 [Isosphaeraceae bacterium]|nr:hypothetical protein [Isosphaeraceae bacterium]